jgi:hypothetical protein
MLIRRMLYSGLFKDIIMFAARLIIKLKVTLLSME